MRLEGFGQPGADREPGTGDMALAMNGAGGEIENHHRAVAQRDGQIPGLIVSTVGIGGRAGRQAPVSSSPSKPSST